MSRADLCRILQGGLLVLGIVCATPPAFAASTNPAEPSGTAGMLVQHFHMKLVPEEGVWFSVSYLASDQLDGNALPARYGGRDHGLGNAIVCVATVREFSALHRLQTDEVWHFYGGTPLELLLLFADGHGQSIILGPNVMAGQVPQFTVPHGTWMGAAPRSAAAGAYSFFGTQLAPAFDAVDFEMGYRDELLRQYPAFAKQIERLTRADFATAPADRPAPKNAAPRAAAFFGPDVPLVAAAPGVTLRELVGRVAQYGKTTSVSVAKFTLAPGKSSGKSFNHRAQEIFLVIDGAGLVHLGDEVFPVTRDSTVFIPAESVHSIEADAKSTLSFYAISAPAFSPDDYVLVKP